MTKFKEKIRQSNFELLRIVSMFLVLVVHADFNALGSPSPHEIISNTTSSFIRILIESISIICVNVFILISGWFGIHSSMKGFAKFIFQCIFFLWGIYAFLYMTGLVEFRLQGIAGCLLLLQSNWFIKAYLVLLILSPVLNAFVKQASEKQLQHVLIGFYTFSTLYAWISNGAKDFESGYSSISFIGLYLLARYIKLYPLPCFKMNKYFDLLIWGSLTFFISIFYIILGHISPSLYSITLGRAYVYSSPTVILCALFFFLFFSKIQLQSKFINWIGASSFAVFLLHTNPNLYTQYFIPSIRYLSELPLSIILIFSLLVIIFIAAILLDQVRKMCWKYLERKNFS